MEATAYSQQSDGLVRFLDGNMPSNGWRHKVESDMAISGLVALKNILDLLYENGKRMIDIAGSLTMWLVSHSLASISLKCDRCILCSPLAQEFGLRARLMCFHKL